MTNKVDGGNSSFNPLLDPEMMALFMPPPKEGMVANPKENPQNQLLDKMLGGFGISETFSQDILDEDYYKPNGDKDLANFYTSIVVLDIVLQSLDASKPVVSSSLGVGDKSAGTSGTTGTGAVEDEALSGSNKARKAKEGSGTTADDTIGGASGVAIPGWNPWLAASYLVVITMCMMEMARTSRLARIAEMGARIAAMGLVMESAYNIGNAIKEAAEKQAEMLMIQGIGSCIQAAFGGLSMITGVIGAVGTTSRSLSYSRARGTKTGEMHADGTTPKYKYEGTFDNYKTTGFQGTASVLGSMSMGLGSVGQGIGGMVSSFGQIGPTIEKGLIERYQKIQEGLKDIYNQLMSTSQESDKNLADLVAKCLEMLKMVYEAALQAHKGLTANSN